jgi:DNA-binding MarR family transcriptional regulator
MMQKVSGDCEMSSYFVMPNDVLLGEITPREIVILAYLYSRKTGNYDAVQVSQKVLGQVCGMDVKTVRKCVIKLVEKRFVKNVFVTKKLHSFKYEITVYELPKLPQNGYFFVQRMIFKYKISPKIFTLYLFMCKSKDSTLGLSWNSYNDIKKKLGKVIKSTRYEVLCMVKTLTKCGLIKKSRKKGKTKNGKWIFIDNVYRIIKLRVKYLKKSARYFTNFIKKVGCKIPPNILTIKVYAENRKNILTERKKSLNLHQNC